jgi:hypothetical protein
MSMARVGFAIIALAACLAGGALAQDAVTFPAQPNGQIIFVMPSGNVGCIFTPQGGTPNYQPFGGGPELICDRVAPQYIRMLMTPTFIWRYNDVAERNCCETGPLFDYGKRWTQGPFVCDSTRAGLSCRRPDGRGFLMNRTDVIVR